MRVIMVVGLCALLLAGCSFQSEGEKGEPAPDAAAPPAPAEHAEPADTVSEDEPPADDASGDEQPPRVERIESPGPSRHTEPPPHFAPASRDAPSPPAPVAREATSLPEPAAPEMENPPAPAAAGDGGDAADTQADDGEDAGLAEREINRITVYFGTDREPFQPDWMWYANQFRWSFIALIIVPAVCFLGRLTLRPEIRRFLPLAGAALGLTAVVVAALAIYGGYRSMRMKQYMDRVGIAYGDERGAFDVSDNEYCHLGRCRVSVPPARTAGVLHRPNPLRGDLWEEESRHYVVMQIEAIDSRPAFFDQVARAATISEGDRQRAFVFIHGFNVTFEGAALRTAQIAVDLDFDGVPIFYSWPSNGAVLEYTRDESAVAWATGHLKEFLADLRISMPDADIHLCAHSMGSRALTGAMRRLSRELAAEEARFQEVILAAPDIDAETFFHDIAPAMRPAAENVTLYSSSTDEALRVSKGIHGYPRAGDSGGRAVYSQHLETVLVVRPRAHDLLGHSYYGDVPAVLQDMRRMIAGRLRPDDRGLTRTADRAWQLAVPNER